MRGLTYRELRLYLLNLSEEDLDTTVTILIDDEFMAITGVYRSEESDSELDLNHFTLVI